MMNEKISTVREISRTINTLELRAADTFERSVALMASVCEARKRHGLAPTFAASALSRAAAATHSFAEANRLIADAHRELAQDQADFGVPRMSGDECPWPNKAFGSAETDGRRLRAVA